MVNHSCEPNAFAFLDGSYLHVRSLKKLVSGDEITFCYSETVEDLFTRKKVLAKEHKIDCRCKLLNSSRSLSSAQRLTWKISYLVGERCERESGQVFSLVGREPGTINAVAQAVAEVELMMLRVAKAVAMLTSGTPQPEEVPETIESQVEALLTKCIPSGAPWPETLEPLPRFRLMVAMLYYRQHKLVPALRNVLSGLFHHHQFMHGPEWIDSMLWHYPVIVDAGKVSLNQAAAKEAKTFPSVSDMQAMAYRYLDAMWHGAVKAFGANCAFTKRVGVLAAPLLAKKSGPPLGSREFEKEFEAAQRRILDWAGLKDVQGLPSKF